ncbi:MAG: squalene/phytoene synthase family protein [Rhodanobacteraceae bacterium]
MSEATFDNYLAQWRDAAPQRALAWRFLRPSERVRFGGLAALQNEWLKAVREVSESQVAATKLGWWREEMQRAAHGEARHPLTQGLFADARVRALPASCWTAAVDTALLSVDAPPAADFASQRAAVIPLARVFAELETRMGFGENVPCEKAAMVVGLGHLTSNLRALPAEVERGRSPLPMNLLARHGMTREALIHDTPARRAALRDYAGELLQALDAVADMDGPLTLFRRVQMWGDTQSLRAAGRVEDPLHGLLVQRVGFRDLLKIWHAARISHHDLPDESSDATA